MKKNYFKKLASIISVLIILVSALGFKTEAYAADELTGLTSMEIVSMMGKGYNIGNTLDATGGSNNDIAAHETSWGNPQINKDLIDGIKAAGFKSVRIPITWNVHIDDANNYTINEAFLARVKEVVDWCYEDELFVIINVHHEDTWINVSNIDTNYKEIGKKLGRVWEQIADYFAEYDQHLIFEGMNEPRAKGTGYEWNGNQACYDAINYLDQVFVDAVRSNTKGHNQERGLMVCGYAASMSTSVLNSIVLPTINGETASNLIVSVHCYAPYDFCLTDNQTSFDPKNGSDTGGITKLMSDAKSLFIDNGVPVIIGECGATNSGNNDEARIEWFDYFGRITERYGIPAFLWDNGAGGTSGGECHKYFNRKTGENITVNLLTAFIEGKDAIPVEIKDTVIDFEPYKDGDNLKAINPYEIGFTDMKLALQSKVNHSETSGMGFSLKVDTNAKEKEALYDISKYAGNELRVVAYVSSKDADTVALSAVNADGTYTELFKTATNEDWTIVAGDIAVEKGMFISFKGTEDTTFYVDDICLCFKDENGNYAIDFVVEEGSAPADSDSSIGEDSKDTSAETVDTTTESSADNAGENVQSEKKGNILIPVLIAAFAVIVIGVVVFLKKNKQ